MSCSIQSIDLDPNQIREKILNMAYSGNSGHIGCAFSSVESILTIYSKFLRINPENPKDMNRDYFVMSKGHGVMALYVCLAEVGVIKKQHLDNYFKDGSLLHGLAEFGVPGIEASGGSLGHGICVAQGMAYGLKKKGSDQKVFCLVGDGEMNEGSFWETIQFISHHKLSNLVIIVDENKFQAMGRTENISNKNDMIGQFESFGLHAESCDGHSVVDLEKSFNSCLNSGKASVLIADTIKGKGVSLFENNNDWHYKKMDEEIYKKAIKELKS